MPTASKPASSVAPPVASSVASHAGHHALAEGLILSPFTRLARLLAGIPPGHAKPIEMTAGDPNEAMPPFVIEKFKEAEASLATYPKIRGTEELRRAIGTWIDRRYSLEPGIDPAREIHPLNGSREGLFFALLPAVGRKKVDGRPLVLMPNPFYQAYLGSAYAANCEVALLNATAASGHLPDLDALEARPDLLARAVAFYLCSPANPQGAMASAAYVTRALQLARQHNFMLFFDECYSEIYTAEAPTGGLEVAARLHPAAAPLNQRFRNLIVFNSLSKRSNLPGLRSGFAAGDGDFLETLAEIRNLTAPQMPGPIQHASAAVWSEEQHVTAIRQAYKAKFDACDAVLGSSFGYKRPDGGFFLWLDVSSFGTSVDAAIALWQRAGIKVVPGAYLAQPDEQGYNPGEHYLRIALVHPPAVIREALTRIVATLSKPVTRP
jgi:N-succinyldiaminopimelate aminotransferase